MVRDCEWTDGWVRCNSLATARRYPPGIGRAIDVCDAHAAAYDMRILAEQAINGLAARQGEDIDEWARRLAGDVANAND